MISTATNAYGVCLLLCWLWWVWMYRKAGKGEGAMQPFPLCLLSVCSLEFLSSFSWRSSFGSSPVFSAMETSQYWGWEGVSPHHFPWASAFTTQGAWLMCLACAACDPGSPSRPVAQGSPLPKAFLSAGCLLKQAPKEGLSCTGIYTCKLNCLILKWKLEATHVCIPFSTASCFKKKIKSEALKC